jgi:allantoin racemase
MNQQLKRIMILHPMLRLSEGIKEFFAYSEDVEVVGVSQGPDVIRSRMDQALAGFDSVRLVKEAERAGFSAIVIDCHGDPNLYHLREAVRIPVLGVMQVAMHFCSLLAHTFSIIVPEELYTKRSKEDLITRYGFESKVASVRMIPFTQPLDVISELSRRKPVPQEIIEPALGEIIAAIKEDDAGAITFGCAALLNSVDELERRLKDRGFDVPIVNPLPFAVEVARLLISQKLSHSVVSFPLAE